MKKLKLFACALSLVMGITSCNDATEDFQDISVNDSCIESIASTDTLFINVTYKGVKYENVAYVIDSNSEEKYLNSEFEEIYNKELKDVKGRSIKINAENDITFYKNIQDNLIDNGYDAKCIKNPTISENRYVVSTRNGYNDLAKVELFDDKNYGQLKITRNLTADKISDSERRMHYIDFNDKCSSLKVYNNLPNSYDQTIFLGEYEYPCALVDAVFIGYEDKDFSGDNIIVYAYPGTVAPAPSFPKFNDKMSSFRFFFAQRGQYP